ncbi:MAG: ADP-ribosylglycohydrolase family protein [Trueperaceae bacterium]|nr:ADP-ribosylglycohydrolase family protein [Trueperaceae bacterium]
MLHHDTYLERTYAGVLGKLIGVYLGRPFEMWSHERILAELGTIEYYVHDRFGMPLVVTDDDIAGTFTFARALADYGDDHRVTPAQIGRTWLNYIVENRTILWWGGNGHSTEHTAYLHLKRGVDAPDSGSIARNGLVVAEQIGAQIFIDAWAMLAPGDPALAADLARRAASVSHDGVAIHAAQFLAAMEALAYVERDLDVLIDVGLSQLPADSLIVRLVQDVRGWHAQDDDWITTRRRIVARYGTDTYGGNCHVVPNHALIVMSLLYGGDDLQRALSIACTAGWDTDCNAGNVGCLLGIKNGLPAIDAGPDWRTPVADRLYLSTADGERCISDASIETYELFDGWLRANGEVPPARPKGGARFHFELPGSTQGFMPADAASRDIVAVANELGHSREGTRSLALRYRHLALGRTARVTTATFIPLEAVAMPGYVLLASPTLEAGHTVVAHVEADADAARPIRIGLIATAYDGDDAPIAVLGPIVELAPGERRCLEWTVDHDPNLPIFEFGLELASDVRADGAVYLDALGWSGTPQGIYGRPQGSGNMWRRAWVSAMDHVGHKWPEAFHLAQDHGRGFLIRGGRTWRNYTVQSAVQGSVAESFGLVARVQGLERYYALEVTRAGTLRLVKALDGRTTVAEEPLDGPMHRPVSLSMHVHGTRIEGWVEGGPRLAFDDGDRPFLSGGIGFVCEEGLLTAEAMTLTPG